MVERGEHLRFALEAVAAIVVFQRGLRQDLQGDISFEPRIAGAKHFAHPACPERAKHFVGAESKPGRQHGVTRVESTRVNGGVVVDGPGTFPQRRPWRPGDRRA